MLPDYVSEPAAYVDAVLAFAREHGVKVVMPVGDANITLLAPHRERFTELGAFLAVASDAALEIANDKTRTLEVAAKLDIAYPKSVHGDTGSKTCARPRRSSATRTCSSRRSRGPARRPTGSVPVEVVNEAEATRGDRRASWRRAARSSPSSSPPVAARA